MSKSQSKPTSRQPGKTKKSSTKANTANPRRHQFFLLIGLTVLLLSAAAFTLLGEKPPAADVSAKNISVGQAYEKYNQGVFFLDVRQPEEWEEFHAPNSTLIPLAELESRVNELPQDQEIVVVCRSGNRSQAGRDILLSAGFSQVSSMDGGLTEWRDSGYPITTGP